jgi:hypothetical protein
MQDFKRIKDLLKPNVIKEQGFAGPKDPQQVEFTPEMEEASQDASRNYAEVSDQRKKQTKLDEVFKPVTEEDMPGIPGMEDEEMVKPMSGQETADELNKDSGVKQLQPDQVEALRQMILKNMR